MKSAKDTNWYQFWDERGRSHPDDDPIAIDGWDYGISMMREQDAAELRDQVATELKLTSQDKFLEVGCGAGMYLLPLSDIVDRAVGCDLAETMLKRARQFDTDLMVQVAEAGYLPYPSAEFDAVLVYSVFHYFPSFEYTSQVLEELFRVCKVNGRIWIGDIPDISMKEQALSHREKLMKSNSPRWTWPNIGPLEQRFYDHEFFAQFAEEVGCKIRLVPQSVVGYVQGQYRFNVCLEK